MGGPVVTYLTFMPHCRTPLKQKGKCCPPPLTSLFLSPHGFLLHILRRRGCLWMPLQYYNGSCACVYVCSNAYSHVVAVKFSRIDYSSAQRYRCKTRNYTGQIHTEDIVISVHGQILLCCYYCYFYFGLISRIFGLFNAFFLSFSFFHVQLSLFLPFLVFFLSQAFISPITVCFLIFFIFFYFFSSI